MIENAFKSYEKLIRRVIASNDSKKIRAKVTKIIRECLRICRQLQGDATDENLWIRTMKLVNGFIRSESQQKIFLKV